MIKSCDNCKFAHPLIFDGACCLSAGEIGDDFCEKEHPECFESRFERRFLENLSKRWDPNTEKSLLKFLCITDKNIEDHPDLSRFAMGVA